MKISQILESTDQVNVAAIKKAMREQISKPTNAAVNSETAFVKQKLDKAGEAKTATTYWNWCCMQPRKQPTWVDEEVLELQKKLIALDHRGDGVGKTSR